MSPTIAVCYPSSDMVHADFTLALTGLCLALPRFDLTVVNAKSSIVAEARNSGVEQARAAKAEYLMFIDTDMVFPPNLLHRLVQHQKDVVGCVYARRQPPYTPIGTLLAPDRAVVTQGLVEMARLPTGCMLIRMALFDRLAKPWFRFEVDPKDQSIIGEDFAFCDAARAAGFHIWADLELSQEIGHIGQRVCRVSDAAPPMTVGF